MVPTADKVEYGTMFESENATPGALMAPDEADVRKDTQYGVDGTTRTGTCAVPDASDVREGVNVSDVQGTLVVPADSDIRYGVGTGTCQVPAPEYVLAGVSVDATVGSLNPNFPDVSDVRDGVQYASEYFEGGTHEGTLDLPAITHVRSGVSFDNGNQTGNLAVPSGENVRFGEQYGADGTQQTGLLVVPAAADVRAGVFFEVDTDDDGIGNTAGTLAAAAPPSPIFFRN